MSRFASRLSCRALCTASTDPWLNAEAHKGKVSAAVHASVRDLSLQHGPIGRLGYGSSKGPGLRALPSTEEECADFALPAGVVAQYLEDGFITGSTRRKVCPIYRDSHL